MLYDPLDPNFDATDRLLFDALSEAEAACCDPKQVVSKALSVIQLYAGYENQKELCEMLRQMADEVRRVYLASEADPDRPGVH